MSTEPDDLNEIPATPPVEDLRAASVPPAHSTSATSQAPGPDPRRRLRELLAVPERDRSDEQWDEINELEIQLAPGNRINPGQGGYPGAAPSGGGGGGGRHFQQKKHPPKGDKGVGSGGGKRRPRPNKPQQG
jgi:hypothetical protein